MRRRGAEGFSRGRGRALRLGLAKGPSTAARIVKGAERCGYDWQRSRAFILILVFRMIFEVVEKFENNPLTLR